MLSLIYGNAMEITYQQSAEYGRGSAPCRIYRAVNGRCFLGVDTDEIAHVCDRACAEAVLSTGDWVPADAAYVDVFHPNLYTDGTDTGTFPTVDVVDFDPGDDPYILCEACDASLVYDEAKYIEQYGRPMDMAGVDDNT